MDPISRTTFMGSSSSTKEIYWISVFGGPGTGAEFAEGITADTSGNIYVCGHTTSQGQGSRDGLLIKYDTNGVLQWQRILGGTNSERFYGVTTDNVGDVYVCGDGQPNQNGILIKYNSAGTVQWQRAYGPGTAVSNTQYQVTYDSSLNRIYTVATLSGGSGFDDIGVLSYSTAGTLTTQARLTSTGLENAYGVAARNSSGRVYVCGDMNGDAFIAIYSGNVIGTRLALTGSFNQVFYSVASDVSGNAYACGAATNSGGLIAKYDSTNLSLQWQYVTRNVFGVGEISEFRGIAVDSSGYAYACGSTTTSGADIAIVKFNPTGGVEWARALGSTLSSGEVGYDIAVSSSGSICVCGYTGLNFGASGYQAIVAKLPSDGSLTGTYGNFYYLPLSAVTFTGTYTEIVPSVTATIPTNAGLTPTLTNATSSFTFSTVYF